MNNDVKIPKNWNGPNPGKTRTKLLEDQKADFLPNKTFDLDKDGIVGGRELMISKLFDKDKDGILNEQEGKAALDALHKGFEKNFVWGVENSGPNRSYRIIQKRGKICDSDDFGAVIDTYPRYPSTALEPLHKTYTELKEFRKANERAQIESEQKLWEEAHPPFVDRPYIPNEFLVPIPVHSTYSEIKSELKKAARAKVNLNEEGDFAVSCKPAPSLNYVSTPAANGKKELEELRKKNNLTELK